MRAIALASGVFFLVPCAASDGPYVEGIATSMAELCRSPNQTPGGRESAKKRDDPVLKYVTSTVALAKFCSCVGGNFARQFKEELLATEMKDLHFRWIHEDDKEGQIKLNAERELLATSERFLMYVMTPESSDNLPAIHIACDKKLITESNN
jgi:hypothetical protein